MIHLYALETTGERRHLATRQKISATFETQCQAWTEKHGMPLAVIRDASHRTVKTVKVFYPRGTGIFDAWQAQAARERIPNAMPDDVITAFVQENALTEKQPTPIASLLKHKGETLYPRASLPYVARPQCNCHAEVIPYLRTFSNGTTHVYIDCSVCGKSTEGAIKRTLLPPSIFKALFNESSTGGCE